jgi:hypothetical protein
VEVRAVRGYNAVVFQRFDLRISRLENQETIAVVIENERDESGRCFSPRRAAPESGARNSGIGKRTGAGVKDGPPPKPEMLQPCIASAPACVLRAAATASAIRSSERNMLWRARLE